MEIRELAQYKVVEFDKGILILNALDNMMNRPGAVELIMSDPKTIGEYLLRYLHARSKGAAGVSMREAHKQALQGAIVTRKGALDG